MPRKLTTEQFIEKAKKIHGDKYDYSGVIYEKSNKYITIICPIHGTFLQLPNSHLRFHNCPNCGKIEKIKKQLSTKKEFIEKSIKIHGNKYDYSLVNYLGNKNNVKIICKLHGMFPQTPNNHLNGAGCPVCARLRTNNYIKNNIQSNTNDFIKKSRLIHGRKYDYSKVIYEKSNKKIEIICPNHGPFFQQPNAHLNGQGCSICYGRYNFDYEIFIKKSRLIHGRKYDYSRVVYINSNTNVIILCPTHGEFSQKPSSHWYGFGCPKCSCYRISKPEMEFLDYIGIDNVNRQICISQKKVDGLDPKTNTIYEFLGDYWHGNPWKYNKDDLNKRCKKTFGKLYNETVEKFLKLKNVGYDIKYIWESNWKEYKDGKVNIPKIISF